MKSNIIQKSNFQGTQHNGMPFIIFHGQRTLRLEVNYKQAEQLYFVVCEGSVSPNRISTFCWTRVQSSATLVTN